MKSTKRSLLASGLALAASVALLAGTTFAWFTDTVTNKGNVIQAGTLDIDLLMYDEGENQYVSIADVDEEDGGDIFNQEKDGPWEPNKTQIVYLAIENRGKLAASIDFTVMNTQEGNVNLGDVLQLALIEDASDFAPITAKNWEELTKGLSTGVNLFKKLGDSRTPIQDRVLEAGETLYFALAVHMNEEAGNEYKGASCIIDVLVHADQAPVETDGFDTSDYDEQARFSIDTQQEFKDALSRPVDGATYVVNADGLTIPNATASKDAAFTIDLNGHTVTLTGANGYRLDNKEIHLTLTDTSDAGDGVLLHTGKGFVFTSDGNDSITGATYVQNPNSSKDSISNGGTITP